MTELLVQAPEKMFAQRQGDRPLRRDLAQAYRIHANLQRLLNHQQVAQESYLQALTHLEALVAIGSSDPQTQERLAETLRDQSNSLVNTGNLEGAIAALTRASEVASKLHGQSPQNSSYARTAATIQLDLPDPLIELGKPSEALKCAQRAADELRLLANGPDRQANDEALLLLALNRQAELLRDLDQRSESVAVLTEGLARARAEVAASGSPDARHALARLLWNLAQSLEEQDFAKASTALAEATAIWDDLIRRFPQRAFYQRYRALAAIAEGRLKSVAQQHEAGACFQQARDRLEPIVKAQPASIPYRDALAAAHMGLAEVAQAAGRSEEAKVQWELARNHLEQIARQNPKSTAAADRLRAVEEKLRELVGPNPG